MKKMEKTKKTTEKILNAAINEFGTFSYEKTSISNLCRKYNISKGLIYHNFKSKDELYLKCTEICYKKLTLITQNIKYNNESTKENIKLFLTKREDFFKNNPLIASIFFNSILNPPKHLKNEINILKQELNNTTKVQYKNILNQNELRMNITIDQAIEYLITFQEMFNIFFQNKINTNENFKTIIEEHELNLIKILDIILYGIVRQ